MRGFVFLLVMVTVAFPLDGQEYGEALYDALSWTNVGPARGGRSQAVGAADSFAELEPFIEIVVDNRHINDVRIWAVSRAGNEYLGVVSGKDRATFTHPWSRPDDLQLRARTLGGRSFTTRAIDTTPGEAVELLISASFAP